MAIVGTAYVVVRAISDKVGQEIKKGVEDGAKSAAPSATKAGETIGDSIGKGAGAKIRDELPKTTEPAGDEAGKRTGNRFTTSLGNSLRAGLGKVTSSLDKLFTPKEPPERRGKTLAERFTGAFTGTLRNIPTLPFVAILGLPAIAQAINAVALYASSLVSIVGAIGPALAGGAGVALSGVTVLAQGMIALKLALAGTGPEMDRLKKSATDFKTSIVETVSGNALPGFQAALNTIATSLLPVLRTQLGGTGTVLGDVAKGFATMLTSAQSVAQINTLLGGNNAILRSLGSAATGLGSAFLTIAVAAQPLVAQFAEFISKSVQLAVNFLNVKNSTGELSAFFVSTGATLKQLGQIAWDFGAGIVNVFKAAAPAGQPLLDSMATLMQRFKDFTGSVQGQATLGKFFSDALPVIHEVNGLIGDIGRALGQSFSGANTAGTVDFVKTLRDMVPAIQQMLTALSSSGPGLGELAKSFADLMTSMANSGALGAFTTTLDLVFQAVTAILDLPFVGQIAGWGLAIAGTGAALDKVTFGAFGKGLDAAATSISDFVVKSGGIGPAASAVGDNIGRIASAVGSGFMTALRTAGTMLTTFATGLRAVGLAIWTALGPVGLIIAGIALLVAAAIYAYNNFEPFRNLVDTVAASLVAFGKTVIDKVVGAFNSFMEIVSSVGDTLSQVWTNIINVFNVAVGIITDVMSTVGNAFSTAWDALSSAVSVVAGIVQKIVDVITFPFQGIAVVIQGVMDVISGIFTGDLDKVISGVTTAFGGLLQFFLGWPLEVLAALQIFGPMLMGWITNALSFLGGAISTGFTAVVGFFAALPGQIIGALVSLGGLLAGWMTTALSFLWNAIVTGLTTAVSFYIALPGQILAAVSSFGGMLWGWISGVLNTFNNFVNTGVATAIAFFASLPGRALGALASLAGTLASIGSSALSALGSAISSGVSTAVSFLSSLPGRAASMISALPGQLASIGSQAMSSLASAVSNGIGNVVSGLSGLGGRMLSAVSGIAGDMLSAGSRIMSSLAEGVASAGGKVVAAAQNAVQQVRNLLPFSPAKTGPFSGRGYPLYSGMAISSSLAEGIRRNAGQPIAAAEAMVRSMNNMMNTSLPTMPSLPALATPAARSIAPPVDMASVLAAQVASLAATFSPNVVVKIGETELTDLVDTRVEYNTDTMATDLSIGRRSQL